MINRKRVLVACISPSKLYGPAAYIIRHIDKLKPLYIGSSKRGLARALDHYFVCTHIEILPTTTVEEARILERTLIRNMKPEFNLHFNY